MNIMVASFSLAIAQERSSFYTKISAPGKKNWFNLFLDVNPLPSVFKLASNMM
jgi:hypothetical protein